jgi:hypothetical protein
MKALVAVALLSIAPGYVKAPEYIVTESPPLERTTHGEDRRKADRPVITPVPADLGASPGRQLKGMVLKKVAGAKKIRKAGDR